MNVLKLKEFNADYVLYQYQPEGRREFGEVILYFAEGVARILKCAGGESRSHDNMALAKIEELIETKKSLPMEFIQAWY